MVKRTKAEAEKTRAAILKAALDCFYEKGFSKTTPRSIASKIGMTRGAVYWHFRSKTDVFVEVVKATIQRNVLEVAGKFNNPKSLSELSEFFKLHAEHLENNKKFRKFLFFIFFQLGWSDVVLKEIDPLLGEAENFYLKTVRNALLFAQKSGEIGKEQNIEDITMIIVGTWYGLRHMYITGKEGFSPSEIFIKGLETIIEGVRVKKG